MIRTSGLLLSTLCWSTLAFSEVQFYRVFTGERPADATDRAYEEFINGGPILYASEAKSSPVRIDGIVWHSGLGLERFYVGTKNPASISTKVGISMIDDKLQEAVVLTPFFGDLIPKSMRFTDFLRKKRLALPEGDRNSVTAYFETLSKKLKKEFPKGYIIKMRDSYASRGAFPSDQTDLLSSAERVIFSENFPLEFPEEYIQRMRFKGDTLLIQERVHPKILRDSQNEFPLEFRIHAVGGRVVPELVTLRHSLADLEDVRKEAAKVEREMNLALARLPADIRDIPYAFDVMISESDKVKVIEANVGGESGFLSPEVDILLANLLVKNQTGADPPFLVGLNRILSAKSIDGMTLEAVHFFGRPEMVRYLRKHPEGLLSTQTLMNRTAIDLLRNSPTNQNWMAFAKLYRVFSGAPLTTKDEKFLKEKFAPQVELDKVMAKVDCRNILSKFRRRVLGNP